MKKLVLGLFVVACGRSPGSPLDASVATDGQQSSDPDASSGMSSDAPWMDVADPPDSLATPCPGTLGFPSVPLRYRADRNVAVDVDGDLLPDLVQVNNMSVMVSHGRGNGTFDDGVAFPIGGFAYDVVVTDLDGDAKPDVVVTLQNNTIVALRNQGALSFGSPVTVASLAQPYLISSADLDGDHVQDLVVVSDAGTSTIAVYMNHGDGTFAAPVTYAAGSYTTGLALGDVVGDGKPDVVITDIDGTAGVYATSGSGTLAAPITLTTDHQPRWVVLADVAGDSKLDVVVSEQAPSGHLELGVFTNLGTSFDTRKDYEVGGSTNPMRFALADFDGDGHLDAVLNAGTTDPIDVLGVARGTAAGGFETAVPYWNWSSDGATTADLNHDGKPDIVASSQYTGTQILLNAGNGTFPAPTATSIAYQPAQLATRDLDGDGMLDLVVAGNESYGEIYFNDGHGGFVAPIAEAGVVRPTAILFGDIDGNGIPDVVIPDRVDPHKAAVWIGHGNRLFTSSVVSLPIDAAISALVDVNHDGVRDLVVADDTQLMVLTYQANGTFAVTSSIPTTAIAAGIVAGDLNHDGSQDVVVSHQSGGATTFIGNGASGWAAQIDIPSVSNSGLALGDIDGNGTPDLVTGGWVQLGQGDGSFGDPIVANTGAGALHVRDIDGDGRLDIVGMYGGQAAIGRGNGDGTVHASNYEFGIAPTLAVADLDMDGRPDLIGATWFAASANQILVYPGRCLQ